MPPQRRILNASAEEDDDFDWQLGGQKQKNETRHTCFIVQKENGEEVEDVDQFVNKSLNLVGMNQLDASVLTSRFTVRPSTFFPVAERELPSDTIEVQESEGDVVPFSTMMIQFNKRAVVENGKLYMETLDDVEQLQCLLKHIDDVRGILRFQLKKCKDATAENDSGSEENESVAESEQSESESESEGEDEASEEEDDDSSCSYWSEEELEDDEQEETPLKKKKAKKVGSKRSRRNSVRKSQQPRLSTLADSDLTKLTMVELKSHLREENLTTTGNKAALVERLKGALSAHASIAGSQRHTARQSVRSQRNSTRQSLRTQRDSIRSTERGTTRQSTQSSVRLSTQSSVARASQLSTVISERDSVILRSGLADIDQNSVRSSGKFGGGRNSAPVVATPQQLSPIQATSRAASASQAQPAENAKENTLGGFFSNITSLFNRGSGRR